MLTVLGQQHSFSTHERMSFESANVFETENVSTWEGLEPPTFGFMPNALTYSSYQGQTYAVPFFEPVPVPEIHSPKKFSNTSVCWMTRNKHLLQWS